MLKYMYFVQTPYILQILCKEQVIVCIQKGAKFIDMVTTFVLLELYTKEKSKFCSQCN
jgi:hypothetical protein